MNLKSKELSLKKEYSLMRFVIYSSYLRNFAIMKSPALGLLLM